MSGTFIGLGTNCREPRGFGRSQRAVESFVSVSRCRAWDWQARAVPALPEARKRFLTPFSLSQSMSRPSPTISTRRACPIRTCSSARPASTASPTTCSGRSATRSFTSRRCTGGLHDRRAARGDPRLCQARSKVRRGERGGGVTGGATSLRDISQEGSTGVSPVRSGRARRPSHCAIGSF